MYYIICTTYCILYTIYYILYTVYCILYTIYIWGLQWISVYLIEIVYPKVYLRESRLYLPGSTISLMWSSIVRLMDLFGTFQPFSIYQLHRVNLYYGDILKLKTYEWLYSYIQKLSTEFAIVITLLCII